MMARTSIFRTDSPVDNVIRLMGMWHLKSQSKYIVAISLVGLISFPLTSLAQTIKGATPALAASAPVASKQPAPPAVKASAAVAIAKPSWSELNPMQKQALKPLAMSWNSISEAQKRKWLEISKNYPTLPPADQATMHSRMNEWVTLSPQQRAQARLNFAKTKELSNQLTPDEKKAKWQSYQALSPEEKQKLADKGTPKPVGAATAVKPVPPQKLTVVPKNSPPARIVNPNPIPLAPASGEMAPGSAHPAP